MGQDEDAIRLRPRKGRGATGNPDNRYDPYRREAFDDGWGTSAEEAPLRTTVGRDTAKGVLTFNDSPDLPFDRSVNPYRGCEHGCVYCLAGDTRILMADGSLKPLAALEVGDEIYGTEKRGHYRRYVHTRVLAHWRTAKPVYRIFLADGTELVASGDHRFLTERGWKFVARSDGLGQRPSLTLNNTLMGFGIIPSSPPLRDAIAYRRGYLCGLIRGDGHLGVYRYSRPGRTNGDQHRFRLAMADTEALERAANFLEGFGIGTDRFTYQLVTPTRRQMEAIRTSSSASVAAIGRLIGWPDRDEGDWMRGFVAGMFDAEGSFSDGVIRISNTDRQTIEVLTGALRGLGFNTVVETARPLAPKPVYVVRIRGGLREHLRFFGVFDPSIARKRNIEAQAVKSEAKLDIVEIEPLGRRRELFDITTGTGNFIANGVISHNCYARPTHAYLGLSPGLDFETRLFCKPEAAELLARELSRPGYRCAPIALGVNTDAWQPVERRLRITRALLEALLAFRHPVTVITKSALIERDLDLLAALAERRLVASAVSVTTLDRDLARRLEPRATAPERRIETIRRLHEAGVPVGVMVAPVIPVLTDAELETILKTARAAGASWAGYTLLRLPLEVSGLFQDWLAAHEPLKAAHVMSRLREARGGRENDPRFGARMRGTGPYADMIAQRFRLACRRLGFNRETEPLDCSQFRPPPRPGEQLELFGDDNEG